MPNPHEVQRPTELNLVMGNIKTVTSATTLTPSELNVQATAPASGSYAITLPPAVLWAGRVAVIRCTGTAGTGEISIASSTGDARALSVGDNMTVAGDYVVLFSTGDFVIVLSEVTT